MAIVPHSSRLEEAPKQSLYIERLSKREFLEITRDAGRMKYSTRLKGFYTDKVRAEVAKKTAAVEAGLRAAEKEYRDFEDLLSGKSERIHVAETETDRMFQRRLTLEEELSNLQLFISNASDDVKHLQQLILDESAFVKFFNETNLSGFSVEQWCEYITPHMLHLSNSAAQVISESDTNRETLHAAQRDLRILKEAIDTQSASIKTAAVACLSEMSSHARRADLDKQEIDRVEKSINSLKKRMQELSDGVFSVYSLTERIEITGVSTNQLLSIEYFLSRVTAIHALAAASGRAEVLKQIEARLEVIIRRKTRAALLAAQAEKARANLEKITREANKPNRHAN